MPMDECIESLLFLQQSAEDSFAFKSQRVGQRVNKQYDQEMQLLARIATHHACNLIEQQYKASQSVDYDLKSSGMSPTFHTLESKASQQTYAVNLKTSTCSCVFNQTQLLLCRQVIFLRRILSRAPVISYDAISSRWSLLDESDDNDSADDLSGSFSVADVSGTKRLKVMSHNTKYKTVFEVCQRIAEVVADKGTGDCNRWLDQLKVVERNVCDNEKPAAQLDVKPSGMIIEGLKHPGVLHDDSGDVAAKRKLDLDKVENDVVDYAVLENQNSHPQPSGVDTEEAPGGANTGEAPETKAPPPMITLNQASRPSGRPKIQKAVKKAKQKQQFKESEELATQLTTIGDITLASFSKVLQQNRLTLCDVEAVFDGLRLMHSDAVFKRPKAKLITAESGEPVEDKVRGILPSEWVVYELVRDALILTDMLCFGCVAALVTKCMTAVRNLKMREKAMSGTSPPEDRIVVMILNVGTFRSTDINIMNEWHSVAKLVKGARSLVAWAKSVALDDPADQEERDQIVDTIVSMDMRASINSGGQSVEFAELVRFGDEGWLSDQCIVSAATRIAAEASWSPPPTIHVVNPTLASFKDDKQRTRSIDSKKCLFSKCHDELTILAQFTWMYPIGIGAAPFLTPKDAWFGFTIRFTRRNTRKLWKHW